jgi:hypothetical protein
MTITASSPSFKGIVPRLVADEASGLNVVDWSKQYNDQSLVGNQDRAPFWIKATYAVGVDGGAIGVHYLKADGNDIVIPKGFIISKGLIEVLEICDSAADGSSINIKVESADDVLATTAEASIAGLVDIVPVGTDTTAFKLTADRRIAVEVEAEALTAGVFTLYLDGFVGTPA